MYWICAGGYLSASVSATKCKLFPNLLYLLSRPFQVLGEPLSLHLLHTTASEILTYFMPDNLRSVSVSVSSVSFCNEFGEITVRQTCGDRSPKGDRYQYQKVIRNNYGSGTLSVDFRKINSSEPESKIELWVPKSTVDTQILEDTGKSYLP